MNPIGLEIDNFMGFKHTLIDLSKITSVLIVGKSKNNPRESNGVGKTTIFHAIEFALFGAYPTSVINNIVRDGCDSCKVIFDFAIDSSIYRIERVRSVKGNKTYIKFWQKNGDSWQDPIKLTQKTPTETKNEIIKKIGINERAFKSSVLFAQADLEGLASAKPSDRLGILKEALGLSVYKKFEKIAKDKRDEVSKKLSAQEAIASSLGDPSKDIEEINKQLKENKAFLLSKTKAKDSQNLILSEKRTALSDIKYLVSSEVSVLNDKLNSIIFSKKELKSTIETLERSYQNKSREISSLNEDISTKEEILKNNQLILRSAQNVEVRSVEEIKKDLSKAIENENNGRVFIGGLIAKAKDLSQPLPKGDACPACRQPMSEEHRRACQEKIDQEITALESEIKINNKRLEKVTKNRLNLENELESAHSHNRKINNLTSKVESKKLELENDKKYLSKISDLKSQTYSELELNKRKLDDIKNREDSIRASIDDAAVDEVNAKVISLSKEIEDIEASINEFIKEISRANTLDGVLSERKEIKEKALEKLKKVVLEVNKLEREYFFRQKVMKGFSSGGIPTMIIHTILDDLQIEANLLLADLKPGLELQFSVTKEKDDGKVEDTLEITFVVHGKNREYAQLSGGQKLLFALSLKLGLSFLIQKRLGVNIKFLELDEVDAMLDKSAVDAFASVIKKWQKFFKILVITHNDGLKDKFDQAILVEGDDEHGSTAKLVNSW